MRPTLFVSLLVLLSTNAAAQTFERLLLPICVGNVAGAYGSRWSTNTTYVNDSAGPAIVLNLSVVDFPIAGLTRGELFVVRSDDGSAPGQFLYVDSTHSATMHIQTRLLNVDANGVVISAGVVIPAVRASSFSMSILHLSDIPQSPHARSMLRIYDLDASGATVVGIRYFSDNDVIGETSVVLRNTNRFPTESAPATPGYAQVSDLPVVPEGKHLFVDIEPLTPGARIWAFATTTDNSTQAVSVTYPRD